MGARGTGRYARGDNALAICERCSKKRLRRHLVYDGQYPDLLVCPECWDPKHPQEYLPPVTDPVTIYDPTGDPDKSQANTLAITFPPAANEFDEVPIALLSVRVAVNAIRYNIISGGGDATIPDDQEEFGVQNLPDATSLIFDSQFGNDAGETNFDELAMFDLNTDGTKMFIHEEFDGGVPKLATFTLSTPWDITSAVFLSESNRTNNYSVERYRDGAWGANGGSIYFTSYNTLNKKIYRHNVAVAYTPDWAALPVAAQTFDISTYYSGNNSVGIQFWPDGLSFVLCGANNTYNRFTMSTAWDITSATLHSTGSATAVGHSGSTDAQLSGDGLSIWILDPADERIYQYSLSVAFDLSTMSDDVINFDLESQATNANPVTLYIPLGRKELYVGWYGTTPATTLLEKYTWT